VPSGTFQFPYGVGQLQASAATSTSVTFTNNTAPQTCIVAYIISNSATTPTITDATGTHTFTKAAYSASFNGDFAGIWYLLANPGGLTGLKDTSGTVFALGYAEVSGILSQQTVGTGGDATAGTTYSMAAPSGARYFMDTYVLVYDVSNGGTAESDGTGFNPFIISNNGQSNMAVPNTHGTITGNLPSSGTYAYCRSTFMIWAPYIGPTQPSRNFRPPKLPRTIAPFAPSGPLAPSPTGPPQVPSPQRFTPPFSKTPPPTIPPPPPPVTNVQLTTGNVTVSGPSPFPASAQTPPQTQTSRRRIPPFSFTPPQPAQTFYNATVALPTGMIIVSGPSPFPTAAQTPPQTSQPPRVIPPFRWIPRPTPQQFQETFVFLTTGNVIVNGPSPTPVVSGIPTAAPQPAPSIFSRPPFTKHRPAQPVQPPFIPPVIVPPAAAPQTQAPPRLVPPFRWRPRLVPANEINFPLITAGAGASGTIKLEYLNYGALTSSYSGLDMVDSFGNTIPLGYMGNVYVQQPATTPVIIEAWHQATLTNAANSGNGVNGFYYRLTTENEVELIWDFNATVAGGAVIFTLPQLYRPFAQMNVATGWYGTGPTSYTSGFAPHMEILGSHDKQPGAISTNSLAGVTTTSWFGHAFVALDVT
jgi:hypothetical protein